MEVRASEGSVKRYVLRKKPPGKLLESAHAVEREFQVSFYFLIFHIARFYCICIRLFNFPCFEKKKKGII